MLNLAVELQMAITQHIRVTVFMAAFVLLKQIATAGGVILVTLPWWGHQMGLVERVSQ